MKMAWRKTGEVVINGLLTLTICCIFITAMCCYAGTYGTPENKLTLDIDFGTIASIGTLILALICALVTVIYKYSGTTIKVDQSLILALEANNRSLNNEKEICGIHAVITAIYDDVKIIKVNVLKDKREETHND